MPQHAPKPLPAAVRKQILLARIAVERVEFVQAVEQFRQQARPGVLLRHALQWSGLRSPKPLGAVAGLVRLSRSHPLVSSLLGSAGSLLLRTRGGRRLLARLSKLGIVGGALAAVAWLAHRGRGQAQRRTTSLP
jgi:hypothetical protein